jgi:hypothetical protein
MVRPLLISLLLAALPHATLAAAPQPVASSLVFAERLSVQLPEGAPDAADRRALESRLQQDHLVLRAEGRGQSTLMATLGDDLRAAEDEKATLVGVAGVLACVLATLLAAVALWRLVLRNALGRSRTPGAWYRPARRTRAITKKAPAKSAPTSPPVLLTARRPQTKGAAPVKSARTSEPPLLTADWAPAEAAAPLPVVREFGRARAPAQPQRPVRG